MGISFLGRALVDLWLEVRVGCQEGRGVGAQLEELNLSPGV